MSRGTVKDFAPHKKRSFICEALSGDYAFTDEDRLSQVFVAAFNTSPKFRRFFFDFVGIKAPAGASARTQQSFWSRRTCRPDICLYAGKRPCLVVENKVDAALTVRQLRSYSRVRELARAKKIALVRHFFEPFSTAAEWRILHWSDLYRWLENRSSRLSPEGIDYFIISNFLSFLEANGMKTATRITRAELRDLQRAYFKCGMPILRLSP